MYKFILVLLLLNIITKIQVSRLNWPQIGQYRSRDHSCDVQGDVSGEGGLPRGAQHGQEMVESQKQESGGKQMTEI